MVMQAIRALRFCGGDLSAAASFAADERARQQARRAQRQKDAELRKEQKLCALSLIVPDPKMPFDHICFQREGPEMGGRCVTCPQKVNASHTSFAHGAT